MKEDQGKATENGWRTLRKEREREFKIDFAPLRRAINRNEFVSASVELFLSALVGVTKINLGARADKSDDTPPSPSEDGTTKV